MSRLLLRASWSAPSGVSCVSFLPHVQPRRTVAWYMKRKQGYKKTKKEIREKIAKRRRQEALLIPNLQQELQGFVARTAGTGLKLPPDLAVDKYGLPPPPETPREKMAREKAAVIASAMSKDTLKQSGEGFLGFEAEELQEELNALDEMEYGYTPDKPAFWRYKKFHRVDRYIERRKKRVQDVTADMVGTFLEGADAAGEGPRGLRKLGFAVRNIQVSPNCTHVACLWSLDRSLLPAPSPDNPRPWPTLKAQIEQHLERLKKRIRWEIGRNLDYKRVPVLEFRYDREGEQRLKNTRILKEIAKDFQSEEEQAAAQTSQTNITKTPTRPYPQCALGKYINNVD
eukprot:g62329.t1